MLWERSSHLWPTLSHMPMRCCSAWQCCGLRHLPSPAWTIPGSHGHICRGADRFLFQVGVSTGLHACRTPQRTTAANVVSPVSLCCTLQGDAAAALEKAQALCHRDNHVNMRHILEFLIPVHMLRGRLPPTELLERYNLQALKQISQVKRLGGAARLTQDAVFVRAFEQPGPDQEGFSSAP